MFSGSKCAGSAGAVATGSGTVSGIDMPETEDDSDSVSCHCASYIAAVLTSSLSRHYLEGQPSDFHRDMAPPFRAWPVMQQALV